MNSIYDVARQNFAKALLDWTSVPLALLAYSGGPEFHPEDRTVGEINAHGTTLFVKQSQDIITQTVDAQGYLQTDNVVFETVPVGPPITHFVMISQGTSLASSLPILYIDEADEMPFAPNGLDVVVTPDWFANRGWGRV